MVGSDVDGPEVVGSPAFGLAVVDASARVVELAEFSLSEELQEPSEITRAVLKRIAALERLNGISHAPEEVDVAEP